MSSVQVKIKGTIGYLILNRPAVMNVLDYDMTLGLKAGALELKNNKTIKCVIVKGEGDHFMAGGDISYFKSLVDAYAEKGEAAYPEDIFKNVHSAIRDIVSMDKPVIGCVKGAVAGFGLSLMLACDLVVAADDCVFTAAYCNIGTSPDGGMTYFLPRAIGQKKAMELVLTGDRFSATQAEHWGMLNKVVPSSAVEQEAEKLAAKLCCGPQHALIRSRNCLTKHSM